MKTTRRIGSEPGSAERTRWDAQQLGCDSGGASRERPEAGADGGERFIHHRAGGRGFGGVGLG